MSRKVWIKECLRIGGKVYERAKLLLFLLLPFEWAVAFLVVEAAAQFLYKSDMKTLAVGVFVPGAFLTVLAAVSHKYGPIRMTPTVISCLMGMVGFQIACMIFAFQEAAYRDSDLGKGGASPC